MKIRLKREGSSGDNDPYKQLAIAEAAAHAIAVENADRIRHADSLIHQDPNAPEDGTSQHKRTNPQRTTPSLRILSLRICSRSQWVLFATIEEALPQEFEKHIRRNANTDGLSHALLRQSQGFVASPNELAKQTVVLGDAVEAEEGLVVRKGRGSRAAEAQRRSRDRFDRAAMVEEEEAAPQGNMLFYPATASSGHPDSGQAKAEETTREPFYPEEAFAALARLARYSCGAAASGGAGTS
eukprot:g18871.t1